MVDQEHALAPVSVWAGGAGGECHALAAAASGPLFCSGGGGDDVISCKLEEGIEPDDKAVEGVDVLGEDQGEGSVGEGEVFFCDCVEGKVEKGVGWSGQGGGFEVLDEDLVSDMG